MDGGFDVLTKDHGQEETDKGDISGGWEESAHTEQEAGHSGGVGDGAKERGFEVTETVVGVAGSVLVAVVYCVSIWIGMRLHKNSRG